MDSFYASIKFKSEEEILCFVKEANPEDDLLVIENPICIEEVDIPGIMSGVKIKPWMKVSHENSFTIYGEDLLCIKEMNSFTAQFYETTLIKLGEAEKFAKMQGHTKKPPIPQKRTRGRIPLNEKTGLIGSVDMAREYLETIFRIEFKKEDPDKAQYYPLTVDTVIIHTLQPLVKYPKVCYDRYTRIATFNGKKQGTLR